MSQFNSDNLKKNRTTAAHGLEDPPNPNLLSNLAQLGQVRVQQNPAMMDIPVSPFRLVRVPSISTAENSNITLAFLWTNSHLLSHSTVRRSIPHYPLRGLSLTHHHHQHQQHPHSTPPEHTLRPSPCRPLRHPQIGPTTPRRQAACPPAQPRLGRLPTPRQVCQHSQHRPTKGDPIERQFHPSFKRGISLIFHG